MKCNYDTWATRVPAKINKKMQQVLDLMQDGQVRSRADMLRAANIDPNPRTSTGYPGNEYTDYYLYKMGLLQVVKIQSNQKYFQLV